MDLLDDILDFFGIVFAGLIVLFIVIPVMFSLYFVIYSIFGFLLAIFVFILCLLFGVKVSFWLIFFTITTIIVATKLIS